MYHYIFFICQPFRIVCIVSCIFLLFYTSGKVGFDHLLVGFKFVGKEQTFVTPMENIGGGMVAPSKSAVGAICLGRRLK